MLIKHFYLNFDFALFKKMNVNHSISASPIIVFHSFDQVRTKNKTLQQTFLMKLQIKVQNIIKRKSEVVFEIEKDNQFKSLKEQLSVNESLAKDYKRAWTVAKKWVRARSSIPVNAPELGSILSAMQSAPILKSDVSRKGTQLKLMLTLEGGTKQNQFALFKPKRYSANYITDDIYSGADRHNGEIFGMFQAFIFLKLTVYCLCQPFTYLAFWECALHQ